MGNTTIKEKVKKLKQLCPHCNKKFSKRGWQGIKCPLCGKGICSIPHCKNEVVDWLSDKCREHLLEDIRTLTRLRELWVDFFQSPSNYHRPFIVPGLLMNEGYEEIYGWSTFRTVRYTHKRSEVFK